VAAAGVFPRPLKEEWREFLEDDPLYRNSVQAVPEAGAPPVPEVGTDKQTSFFKQTGVITENDRLWESVLATLKLQLPAASFYSFVADTRLIGMEGDVITIGTPRTFAKDWLENRLKEKLKKVVNLELRMRDGEAAQRVEEIRWVFFAAADTECEA
jgi:hypothetical protein